MGLAMILLMGSMTSGVMNPNSAYAEAGVGAGSGDNGDIIVPEGEQVGCEFVVSGGQYVRNYHDVNYPGAMNILIKEGYHALLDGRPYASYGEITQDGVHKLQVIENSTGNSYLHTFELEASGRLVDLSNFMISSDGDAYSDVSFSFEVQDLENRDFEEAGVIYNPVSDLESYKQVIGANGVQVIKGATVHEGAVSLSSNDFEKGTFLVRPYVKIEGFYHFGRLAKVFDNEQAVGFIANTVMMETGTVVNGYSRHVGVGGGATVEVIGSGAPGASLEINAEGDYWLAEKSNGRIVAINQITIDTTAPMLSNLTEGQIINSPIQLLVDDPEARVMKKVNQAELDYSAGLWINEPGFYVFLLSDRLGNRREVYFEFKNPTVATGDSMSITANSASVSASCSNNGAIVERGFVYSSTNLLPELGGTGVLKKIPTLDTTPTSMTTELENLEPSTTYAYRAFIHYGNGGDLRTLYGDVKTFTTNDRSTPMVMIGHPTGEGIKSRSITMSSFIQEEGGSAISERGILVASNEQAFFNQNISADPAVMLNRAGVSKFVATGQTDRNYTVKADGLSPNTPYYIRAYAVNASGAAQSMQSMFSTTSEIVVTFDLDGGTRTGGGELTQFGDPGVSVVAPTATKSGKTLSGWSNSLENIQESKTIKAIWSDQNAFLVRFDPTGGQRTGGGQLEQQVEKGMAAVAPIVEREGFVFINWDQLFNLVNAPMEISANWNDARYDVTFDLDGGVYKGGGPIAQNIKYNDAAIVPITEKEGFTFSGWSEGYDHIKSNMTIRALWNSDRHQVTFNLNGGSIKNNVSRIQYINHGGNAEMPVVEREGYTFLGWTSDGKQINQPRTIIAHYARLYAPSKVWTQVGYIDLQITDDTQDVSSMIKIGEDDYKAFTRGRLPAFMSNKLVKAKVQYNGQWVQLEDLNVDFVDFDYPEMPKVTIHPVEGQRNQAKLVIALGTDALSGVATNKYRIGLTGEWIEYTSPQTITVPSGTIVRTQCFDKAGNASGSTSYQYTVEKYTYNGKDRYKVAIAVPNGNENLISRIYLKGAYNGSTNTFNDYVGYTSDSYKGCGLSAGKIVMSWYGQDLAQATVARYIETTDFGKYLEWLTEDTWADPSIFTTPAQLDNGLQSMLRDFQLKANVSRYSPNSTVDAVKRIETGLLSGNPVAILVNEGGHWQVISAAEIKWRADGSIEYAQFLCHDNGGSKWRFFEDMNYFFEDNTDAELARLMGYDSYRDTILTIGIEPTTVNTGNSTGGLPTGNDGNTNTNTSGGTVTQLNPEETPLSSANNTFFGSNIVADVKVDGSTAQALISAENINSALSLDPNGTLIQIGLNSSTSSVRSSVTMPEVGLDAIGSSNREMAIGTPHAGIRFNAAAVDGIANQANGELTFSVGKYDSNQLDEEAKRLIGNRPIFEFSITSGGQPITDFGGGTATLSIPYTPKASEDPDNIIVYYIGSDGSLHTVPGCKYNPTTGRVTFNTDHFSLYGVGVIEVSYKDVSEKSWYKDYVQFVSARGIMKAASKDQFKPLVFLSVADLKSSFLALDSGMRAKNTMAQLNKLKATDSLTKQQLVSLLNGLSLELGVDLKEQVSILSEPNKKATRAEAAVLIYKLVKEMTRE